MPSSPGQAVRKSQIWPRSGPSGTLRPPCGQIFTFPHDSAGLACVLAEIDRRMGTVALSRREAVIGGGRLRVAETDRRLENP